MTSIATDIVDVYVFRRLNARVQFLLLQRRSDVPMARTWQAFHHEIDEGQTASDAARAALKTLAGLEIDRVYSADFVNQFYDEARDVVVLAPVLAVTIADHAGLNLADDFDDAGWYDRDQATARLPFSGQRWAVRHIDEIMGIGESEAEMYRFDPSISLDTEHRDASPLPFPVAGEQEDRQGDDVGLEPPPESVGRNATSGTNQSEEPSNDKDSFSTNVTSRQD
jgi:dihydroneopterin triphosphate diphosphatase